jgi:aldehyde dehydrogenase (NAD+)
MHGQIADSVRAGPAARRTPCFPVALVIRGIFGGSASRRNGGFPVGYYVAPTVFTDVLPGMRIFQEEIFGPVLVVVPYDDEDDAVRLHNDSGYGLSGMVFSRDVTRATNVARRLETGQVRCSRAPEWGIGGRRGWRAAVPRRRR